MFPVDALDAQGGNALAVSLRPSSTATRPASRLPGPTVEVKDAADGQHREGGQRVA